MLIITIQSPDVRPTIFIRVASNYQSFKKIVTSLVKVIIQKDINSVMIIRIILKNLFRNFKAVLIFKNSQLISVGSGASFTSIIPASLVLN